MNQATKQGRLLQAMGVACYQPWRPLPPLLDEAGVAWSLDDLKGHLLLVVPELWQPGTPEADLVVRLKELFVPDASHWVVAPQAALAACGASTVLCLGVPDTDHLLLPSLTEMVQDPQHKKTAWRLLQQHASAYLKPKKP